MTPYYAVERLTLLHGDCRTVLGELPECSVDAIVTDPPYGIGFMSKGWDTFSPEYIGPAVERRVKQKLMPAGGRNGKSPRPREAAVWEAGRYDLSVSGNRAFQTWCESWCVEAYRVLKPGGHMLVCGSPRTYHRMACGIEDAGFEIRDCLQWLFGSGFPKSLNLHGEWEGWGTALKPAYEPIIMARKPLVGTVAGNVAAYGTGGMNIDDCRIGSAGGTSGASCGPSDGIFGEGLNGARGEPVAGLGRWPANVLLDEAAAVMLDAQAPSTGAFAPIRGTEPTKDGFSGLVYGTQKNRQEAPFYGDTGGASRFFYTAKTSRAEREFGLEDLEPTRRTDAETRDADAPGSNNPRLRTNTRRNDHPTVKPVDLMRWLCRLVTPPGGTICDPFLGSGSTGMAALDEGFRFIGIDLEKHYLDIAQRRIARRHMIEPLPQRDAGQGVML